MAEKQAKKQAVEDTGATEATATVPAEPTTIGITVEGAILICEIITICTKRGAFNPNELVPVGSIFNQLLASIPEDKRPGAAPQTEEEDNTQVEAGE